MEEFPRGAVVLDFSVFEDGIYDTTNEGSYLTLNDSSTRPCGDLIGLGKVCGHRWEDQWKPYPEGTFLAQDVRQDQ